MILKDILETIGETPIVKLNKVGSDLKCELYANVNFLIQVVRLKIGLENK